MKKVLGFRSDPNAPRYAVVSEKDGQFCLDNASGDNKLSIPADIKNEGTAKCVSWIYHEILAIFNTYPEITRVIIKENEFIRQTESRPKRKSVYFDAAVMLACAEKDIPVEMKSYQSIGINSKNTEEHAENQVGKTSKYWSPKMADAVNAAWWGLCYR